MVLAVMRPPPVLGWPAGWTVLACDVGQGDALLVRAGPRQAVVVDVGPLWPDPSTVLRLIDDEVELVRQGQGEFAP